MALAIFFIQWRFDGVQGHLFSQLRHVRFHFKDYELFKCFCVLDGECHNVQFGGGPIQHGFFAQHEHRHVVHTGALLCKAVEQQRRWCRPVPLDNLRSERCVQASRVCMDASRAGVGL